MRRILLTVTGTLSGLGLLFLYPTSTGRTVTAGTDATASGPAGTEAVGSSSGSTAAGGSGDTSAGSSESSGSSSGSSGSTGDTGGTTASGTYSASTQMQYGTVTVTITVSDGTITDAGGTQDARDGRSQMIAQQAMPTLNSEAVAAQSASIAMVSHATYTSEAYAESLQAALDQVGGS